LTFPTLNQKLKLIDKETANCYQWGNNCNNWILVDTPAISVKQEKIPAGAKERLHFHSKAQQLLFIRKGAATFYYEGKKEMILEQQDATKNHYISNETSTQLEFSLVSQPKTGNDRINVEQATFTGSYKIS